MEANTKIVALQDLDWNFRDANTSFATHSIHPYPAKFIPQIPHELIKELSVPGQTVLDPFCGSGTTLVESIRLGRNAIGIDANPLACMITRAKCAELTSKEEQNLLRLANECKELARQILARTKSPIAILPPQRTEEIDDIEGWFEPHVLEELVFIRNLSRQLETPNEKDLFLTALSSIVVSVSLQDSETRYVRRVKNISPGISLKKFSDALLNVIRRSRSLREDFSVSREVTTTVVEASVLDNPKIGVVNLVVCSPPYPNAFSYHLYHRLRLRLLGMDQSKFKEEEIGSHRKYSRKGPKAATPETFKKELESMLHWLGGLLVEPGYAVFVLGNSTIKGVQIRNDDILIEAARKLGFSVKANIMRNLHAGRKYFNPKNGHIQQESIVILKKQQYDN